MVKTMRNRKAVSPVIATLLLIAIAVAASVVTYSWVMSMVKTQGGQAQTSIRIDEVLFGLEATNKNGIKITIRNTGSVAAVIQTVYVYKGDTQILKQDGIAFAISATTLGEVGLKTTGTVWINLKPSMGTEPTKIYTVTFASDLAVSSAYIVKVVTDNGFTVEGTYYTPSAFV